MRISKRLLIKIIKEELEFALIETPSMQRSIVQQRATGTGPHAELSPRDRSFSTARSVTAFDAAIQDLMSIYSDVPEDELDGYFRNGGSGRDVFLKLDALARNYDTSLRGIIGGLLTVKTRDKLTDVVRRLVTYKKQKDASLFRYEVKRLSAHQLREIIMTEVHRIRHART